MPRIGDVPQSNEPRRVQQSEGRRAQETRRNSESGTSSPADRVELSGDAARLADGVRETPDVREDRVAEVRAKLDSGEYDSDNVKRIIADRILDQLGL